MTSGIVVVFLYVLQISKSDWVSEWMSPVQAQLYQMTPESLRRSGSVGVLRQYEDEYEKMVPMMNSKETPMDTIYGNKEQSIPSSRLKARLVTALENAKTLADALAIEIAEVSAREIALKDTIANGRNGVTAVTVYTLDQAARKYIIREGVWSLCTGAMQSPLSANKNVYSDFIAPARCFGQEVTTKPDPCVFQSMIKYETIPTRRRLQYIEDDYLCLKPTFNNTLEHYMTVPRRLINETCTNGTVRSLDENMIECSVRVLAEYNYYPDRGLTNPDIPLEYCVESDGACKLIVAWHVSNATIEHFAFFKSEPSFKKYFLKYV